MAATNPEGRKKKKTIIKPLDLEEEQESSSEKDDDEIEEFRRVWMSRHARNFGSFQHTTTIPAMRYTFGHIPQVAGTDNGLQVFSIKLILLNTDEWPLHVYGLVAARDCLDPRRNLLFHRTRDNPQILTQHHPFLQLTGPSRAIVLIDPVDFEVQLKAKSLDQDPDQDDQILNFGVVASGHFPSSNKTCFGKRSNVEFRLSLLQDSVEATIVSVQLVDHSSWPNHLPAGALVCRTPNINNHQDDFVLLDSRQHGSSGTMPIDDDGVIQLSRRVVMVQLAGQLIVDVLAFSSLQQQQRIGQVVTAKGQIVFEPKTSSVSVKTCDLGGLCKLRICVAWSLVDTLPPAEYF
uniref:DUF6598 domain-containing protein n=1 Tax=Leersia perrieri TaxID=77586 RepID=A0A0D9XN57_9ORYZ